MGVNRGLYKVYVVDPRGTGKVLLDGKTVIATSETEAQMKAGVGTVISDAGLEFEQVDVYSELISTFIRPRKETQKVVIAQKDED
jgi:hypothetical protein